MLKQSSTANKNYLASIVKLGNFQPHKNADKLKIAPILGNSVIVGIDAKEGEIGVFFPLESQINKEFLSFDNAFSDSELNADKTKKGFFDKNGRVRAVKLRGEKSEGYFVPIEKVIEFFGEFEYSIGQDFDLVNEKLLVKKYEVIVQNPGKNSKNAVKGKRLSRLVDNQFRLHLDTEQLKRNLNAIRPESRITISQKLHGTSAVIARLLTKRKLSFIERILIKLGVRIQENEYGLVYSSRKVVKNQYFEDNPNNHFYEEDIWGLVAKQYEEVLPDGISVYGEIVGFLPSGAAIQSFKVKEKKASLVKPFRYGLNDGVHEFRPYRITLTLPDGKVYELSTDEMEVLSKKLGLNPVPVLWTGTGAELYELAKSKKNVSVASNEGEFGNSGEVILKYLQDTYLEKTLPEGLPDEGICLRIEHPLKQAEIYKLKSFAFLEGETANLDEGVVDIESSQSEA